MKKLAKYICITVSLIMLVTIVCVPAFADGGNNKAYSNEETPYIAALLILLSMALLVLVVGRDFADYKKRDKRS